MTKLRKLQKKKGFTLVELLVAVSILAIVTMALLPRLLPYSEAARTSAANKELRNLNTIVEAFAAVDGDYPEASLDLENPRSIASVMQDHGVKWTDDETGETDPWGNPYYYQSLGGGLYCIISAGPDGVLGTDDDLYIDNFSNLSQGIPPIDMNEIIVPSSSNNPNPGGGNPGGSDGPGEEYQAEVPDGYIGIYTPEQLASIGVDEEYPLDGDYIVMNTIDLSGYVNWTPIGNSTNKFTGKLDGNNYVISNLTINSNRDYKGLFGFTSETSEITNLGLENVDVTGDNYIGGLVGRNHGTITSCYVTGKVTGDFDTGGLVGHNNGTITDCYTTAEVTGGSYTGGLVGRTYSSSITNCYATGKVTGNFDTGGLAGFISDSNGRINKSYATGSVSGNNNRTGGLVGKNYGTITDCYTTSEVTGDEYTGGLVGESESGTLTNCYATGEVTSNRYTGGLVGRNAPGSYCYYCYYDKETTGQSDDDGEGLLSTTVEMKDSAHFNKWDFNTVWDIDEGVSYPYLQPNEQIPHPGIN